jgi:predicted acylesterase/phospholipase RssA
MNELSNLKKLGLALGGGGARGLAHIGVLNYLPPYRLIDGGILNNVPVDGACQMGAEIVIAVDGMPDFQQNQAGETLVVL